MRYYSNTAVSTTLSGSVTSTATSVSVTSTTGFPGSTPFTLALDAGGSAEELVNVTGVSGTTLTVERGFDNTTAVAHSAGAVVQHVHSATDFRESRQHEAATSNVHGVSGTLLGANDAAVLKNKDLSDASNTFPASLATDADVAAHTGASTGVHGVGSGSVVGTTTAQTLTNKTIDVAQNTIKGTANQFVAGDPSGNLVPLRTVPAGEVVGTTDSQTLYNKTLYNPVVTDVGWDTYTPTLVGTGASMGNAVVVGRYKRIGSIVHFQVKMTVGSTTNFGSASSTGISLPVNAYVTDQVCSALLIDTSLSTPGYRTATGFIYTANAVNFVTHEGTTGRFVNANVPWTWADGDVIRVGGTYEASV